MNSNMPLKRSATKIDFIKKNKERLAQTKQRSHSSQPLLKSSLKSPKFPTKSQNSLKSSISKNEFLNYSQNRGRHLKPSDKKPQKSSFAAEDLTKKTPLHMQVTREATLSEEVDETKSTNKDAKPSISFINISNDTEMQLESPDHVPIIIYDFSDSKSFIDDKENINPEDLTYKRGKKSIIVIEVDENMEIKHYQPDVIYSYKFESLCKPVNWILEDEERRVSIEIFENRWSLDERQQARDHLLLITASIKKQSTEKSEVKIIDYPHIQLEYMSQKTSLDSSYQATPVKSQFSNWNMQIETENSQKTKIIQEFTITYQPENRLALHPIVLEKFSIVEKPSLIPSLEVSDNPLLYKNQSDDCQSPNSPYSLISASDQSPIDQSYFSISQQNSDYKNQPIIRRSNRLAIKKIEKGKSKKSTNNLKRKRKTKRNSYENTSEVLETDHYESYRSKREKRS